jgi:carboxymethylenebutenolidase
MAGKAVSFESHAKVDGYLAKPSSGTGPGVIVIQEWWGLNDQIRETADRFASAGFTALAPDFYHGKSSTEPDECGKLMMALNIDRTAKDARSAAEFLKTETGGRVGVIGFCMGGQLALLTGTVAPDEIGAVVDMYGLHPNVKPDFKKMNAPVLALFGEHDDYITDEVRGAVVSEMEGAGIEVTSHVYPGVGHAFMNHHRPEAYDEKVAEDAWGRVIAFFRKNLG